MKNKTNLKVVDREKLTRLDLSGMLFEARNLSAFVSAFAEEACSEGEGREMSQAELNGLSGIMYEVSEIADKAWKCSTGEIDLDGEWKNAKY